MEPAVLGPEEKPDATEHEGGADKGEEGLDAFHVDGGGGMAPLPWEGGLDCGAGVRAVRWLCKAIGWEGRKGMRLVSRALEVAGGVVNGSSSGRERMGRSMVEERESSSREERVRSRIEVEVVGSGAMVRADEVNVESRVARARMRLKMMFSSG